MARPFARVGPRSPGVIDARRCEAALWVARSTDPGDLPAVTTALTRMLESLRERPV